MRRDGRRITRPQPKTLRRRICKQFFPPGRHPKCGEKGARLMDRQLTIWIAVTSSAVILQALIMLAMYLAMRKTSAKVEGLAEEVKTKILPTVDLVNSTVTDLKQRIETIVVNVSESSILLRGNIVRLDATVNHLVHFMLFLASYADELINRTMDKVEDATEA